MSGGRAETVVDTSYEVVELTRACRGTDLFSAVEAAQYARVVDHDEPETGTATLDSFLARFAECSETWDSRSASEQSAALTRLGRHLEELERVGLFVYWAALERDFVRATAAPLRMPMAVVKVTRQSEPPVTLRLPAVMTVDPS